jgi:hypothetical protein
MTDAVLAGLVEGYERELALYARLLAVAEDSAREERSPRGVEHVLGALREKGRLLEEIAEIEARLAPLKDAWAREKSSAPAAAVGALNALLDRVAKALEAILAVEESGSRRFALREGIAPARTRAAAPQSSRAAAYALDATADPCWSVQG